MTVSNLSQVADDLVERHPWVAYVLIVLMALLFSIEVG